MSTEDKEDLRNNKTDVAVSIAKSIVGPIPLVGSAINEIITSIIPNQRLDRIVDYLKELDERLGNSEKETAKNNKYFTDLFEDSIVQALMSMKYERDYFKS